MPDVREILSDMTESQQREVVENYWKLHKTLGIDNEPDTFARLIEWNEQNGRDTSFESLKKSHCEIVMQSGFVAHDYNEKEQQTPIDLTEVPDTELGAMLDKVSPWRKS